ncbi:hypothetical protein QC999_gp71 [Microbacterium phage Cressida]|uniref:Minor tail protein n=1 Tax=Microbacterium phage Cressida TaxID=2591216 RepID=A0A514DI42_9CAUD|nr:hypothetical protein QC999_gp71 [Microbacterium phage Cressida]QDH93279.1 hypothetical protein PBI_CRESSIDA_37 [Microbacterium phage Cressida]
MTGTPRTMEEILKDTRSRLLRVERRLSVRGGLPARLGPNGAQVTDWNLATEAGFYWSEAAALNNPVGNIATGIVTVKPTGANPCVLQEVYFPTSTDSARGRSWRRVLNLTTGVWSAWTRVGTAPWNGTAAQRAATPSQYWEFWQDTDGDQGLYVGNKSGGWRRFSGYQAYSARAWDASGTGGTASIYGRSDTVSLPTTLETNEYLQITPIGVGTGYATMSSVAQVRNPTNVAVTTRLVQFLNATTQAYSYAWQITQY